MKKEEKAILAVNALKKEYPEALCSLNAGNEFELLVATRLSAQCTDARVNIVTPELFGKYKELADKKKNMLFGGRLAEYKYYDMDKVIASALELTDREFGK